jgi:hypothetical protein
VFPREIRRFGRRRVNARWTLSTPGFHHLARSAHAIAATLVAWVTIMHRARRGFAVATLLLALTTPGSGARAADKVRCAAAYEQGQQLRRQDKLSASRSQLQVCEQTCPKALATDCIRWRGEVEALLPSVRLRATDGQGHPVEARVLLDGELLLEHLGDAPVTVDSGDHVFRFEAPSGLTVEVRVSLHGGEPAREIEGVLAPATPPVAPAPSLRPVPLASYVLGGVGIVGLGVGGAFSLAGHFNQSHLQSTCAPACKPPDVDAIGTLYDVAWVSAGVGVASLAVALFLWRPWQSGSDATVSGLFVAPTLAPTLGGITLGGALP